MSKPVALITGASRGLGAELAQILSQTHHIIAISRTIGALEALDDQIKKFGYEVGFSDHTIGATAAIAAVAKGSSIIEKHITLDKNLNGPDHKASTEPSEFKKLVESITAEPKQESSIAKAIKESDADDSIATSIKKEVNEEVKNELKTEKEKFLRLFAEFENFSFTSNHTYSSRVYCAEYSWA